jgi:peptidoglycan hydrolase-like protein with peptidoglycan-binding domain
MKNLTIGLFAVLVLITLPSVSYAQYGGGGGYVVGMFGSVPTTPSVAPPRTPGVTPGSTGGQVLGASVYDFTANLGFGSSGADVTALQQFLTTAGFYTGAITGYFGPLTKAAVVKYQTANGISPTSGYVGPLTRSLLDQGMTPTNSEERSSVLQNLYTQLVNALQELAALSRST